MYLCLYGALMHPRQKSQIIFSDIRANNILPKQHRLQMSTDWLVNECVQFPIITFFLNVKVFFKHFRGKNKTNLWLVSMKKCTGGGRRKGRRRKGKTVQHQRGFCSVMELNSICKGFSLDRGEPDVASCWMAHGDWSNFNSTIQSSFISPIWTSNV